MSASREKKRRQSQPEVTVAETTKKGMSPCLKKTLTAVVAVILVVAIVFLGLVGSGFMQKNLTAAVVNGNKLTPAMLNYYYVAAYNNMSDYIGTVIDTEKPLSEQAYSSEGFDTWADYLIDMAASNAADTYAMYEEAVANGFELTEEAQASIDSELQMLDMYASIYGYADGSGMLTSQYGTGCNKESYQEYLTVNNIASEYATKIQNEFTYTEDEIDAYYNENKHSFDGASYRFFSVTPSVLGLEDGEESLKTCEETANTIAEAAEGGELAFMDAVFAAIPADQQAEYDAETATLREDVSFDAIPEAYHEWIEDEARQEGDVTVVENDGSGYGVIYFLRHEDHTYLLPNVRHILISVADASDETAKTAAKESAQKILDTYLAGEQTEEAFAELAKENSEDNAEDGGLYENITPGMMVETFDAWCYDEARQVGDTGIVETEYGYHVMYFAGYGSTYQDYLVENELRSSDYYEWSQSVTEDVDYSVNDFAKRFLKSI